MGATKDAQDRQLTHAGASFTYGPNGDLTKKTDAVTHAETLFSYDAQGNLRTVTRPAPLSAIEYIIDGQNRRIGKKVGGSLAQGFLYGGTRIIAELDASGAVATRFVYATGSHAPDFMLKGATTYRIVKDHLGSPRLVIDASTGAIAQRLDYDEWGNVTSDTSPGFQPFGFAGGLWDRDTNLVRFGARDYDPTTGRWTSKDSSRFDGGLNFYAYAANDPVNLIDLTGYAYAPAGPNPFRAAAEWLYQASAWNFGQAGDRWDTGNYGGAALNGYFGTSLAALGAIAELGPAIIDGALMMAGTRGGNRLNACPTAGGPHSTFKMNPAGRTSGYATWEPNSRNPTGWDLVKRVDTQYGNPHSHGGVSTPHVHEPAGTRPALPDELPP